MDNSPTLHKIGELANGFEKVFTALKLIKAAKYMPQKHDTENQGRLEVNSRSYLLYYVKFKQLAFGSLFFYACYPKQQFG